MAGTFGAHRAFTIIRFFAVSGEWVVCSKPRLPAADVRVRDPADDFHCQVSNGTMGQNPGAAAKPACVLCMSHCRFPKFNRTF